MNDTEKLWRGDFGDAYHHRNVDLAENNRAFFQRALLPYCAFPTTAIQNGIKSVTELGAGGGENLKALRQMGFPGEMHAVEINELACRRLKAQGYGIDIWNTSVPSLWVDGTGIFPDMRQRLGADLVLTKGFLIHVPPEDLDDVYHVMHAIANRYILIAEYFNVTHEPVSYRGEVGRMWRGPFAYHMLDKFEDLKLVDCGFHSSHAATPQDDLTWFLLEKVKA